jgi:ABC-type uncharacterized transport system auxiliary subunit
MTRNTLRYLAPAVAIALLAGCGLGETAATTAALAESEAQNAKAAKEAQARILKQIDAAQAAADQQLKAAEEASE